MNHKLKLALEKVTPETQLAYAQGHLPSNLVIALGELTLYEQRHLRYEPDPNNPDLSVEVGLFDDAGLPIEPGLDRIPYIQAVVEIFLEDQARYRRRKKSK